MMDWELSCDRTMGRYDSTTAVAGQSLQSRTTVLLELLVIKWAVKDLGGTYWSKTAY